MGEAEIDDNARFSRAAVCDLKRGGYNVDAEGILEEGTARCSEKALCGKERVDHLRTRKGVVELGGNGASRS